MTNNLLIYLNDEPLRCTTDDLIIPKQIEPCTGPEQTAIFQFGNSFSDEEYLKRLFWYNLNKLPRKKKKKLKTLLRKGYSINVTMK